MTARTDPADEHPLLRRRDGADAHVTNEELLFDRVYAFALTRLRHQLWQHLRALGLMQALILWCAVWLEWQYPCRVTNWFDPETAAIRSLRLATLALALVKAASIPEALAS